MQFSMNYDPTLLEFDRVDNLNLSGLTESLFGTPAGGGTVGNITLSWFDNNLTGITLPDGSQIFDVCFTALADGSSYVVFSDTPTFVEISDAAGEIVPFDSKSGLVVIGDGIVNPTDPDDISIAASSVNTLLDSTFCVDLTVQNFIEVTELDFDILFDADVLSFDNANSFGLTGLTEANLTAGDGTIGVSWSGASQTLGNNEQLLSLCFTANDLGTTTVLVDTLTGNYSIQNASAQTLGLQGTSGTIEISPNTISTDFLLEISDQEVPQGGSFCLPVKAYNFNDIIGVQLSIGYDTAALTLNEISSFGLNGLSVGSFGTILPGVITLSWTDDQLTGQTLPTGSTVFDLCFTSKGLDGSSTVVDFMNAPTAIEIINVSEELVVFTGSSGTVTVTGSAPLVLTDTTIIRPCTTDDTGSISITASGGAAPYSYLWSNGATTSEISGIPAGNYMVTVTDAAETALVASFDLITNPPINLAAAVINASGAMTNANGSIALTVTGGTSPYFINWDNGATTANLDGLQAGEYCVTIIDGSGCSVDSCFTVGLDMLDLEFEVTEEAVNCNGGTDGSISIAIRGGATPYEVVFEDEVTLTSSNGMVIRTDLSPGTYNFTVTDAMDSVLSGTATIGEPDILQLAEAIVISTMDSTNCTGQINLTISGGTAPYTMLWDHGVMGLDLNRLCEGTYGGTLTDVNGCSIEVGPYEIDLFTATATVTDVLCPTDENGGIALTLIGGMEPFAFSWSSGGGREISTAQNLTNVGPGEYEVVITDGMNRVSTFSFVINSNSDLDASIVAESDFNGFDISCSDSNDGQLVASGLQGGGTYSYEWFLGGVSQGTGATLTEVGSDTYEAVVTDNNGCIATASYTVVTPNPIAITAQIKDAECFGSVDGAIEADASGGVPAFRYRWSTSDIGFGLYEVGAGDYTVTVTDANNCQTTMDFNVGQADPITVEVTATAANDGCNGTASATITGGTAPYSYIWAGAIGQNTADLVDLCPGEYQVFVTDSRGCQPEDETNTIAQILDRRFPCQESSAVITPNGDGFNDLFIINCVDELSGNLLQIFNSWGQLVYQAQNYDNSWAGTNIDGIPLAEGAYYFVLEYPDIDGNTQQLKGSFNILLD
jgi:gliding motility-associated-like protein